MLVSVGTQQRLVDLDWRKERRLGYGASHSVPGLDQIPESLIPVLLLQGPLGLGALEVVLVVVGFLLVDLALTPVTIGLRRRRARR